MILSTHLYEVAHQFADNKGILFSYFETEMDSDSSFRFTYKLKPGISNDRIGYRILQKEGVISLLQKKS
jgi:DNA mismatch repair ATPase MutS